jgi:hypothetical protein
VKQTINTGNRPMTLMFEIEASKPGVIVGFDVAHTTMPRLYSSSDAEMTRKRQKFYTRMPITPDKAILEIYNVKYPKGHPKRYSDFKVVSKKELPLMVNLGLFDFYDEDLQEVIPFFEHFSERAAILSAGPHTGEMEGGSIYKSDKGKFTIQYVDEIIDFRKTVVNKDGDEVKNPNYLKPATTSMRSNSATGIIQVGRKMMLQYSHAEAMAILLHEFAHFFRNYQQDDEREADYHAAIIYSGLGYGKREFGTAWLKVFERNPYDLNVDRMDLTMKLLNELDSYSFSLGLKDAS